MNIKHKSMILGTIKQAVRQVWSENSNGEVEHTNCLLTSDGNQKSGVQYQST